MGFGNTAAERAALEATYEDTANVSRAQNVKVGALTRTSDVPVYTALPCGLDQSGADGSGQTGAQNNIDYDATLFLAPEADLQPGDRVEVLRLGRTLRFTVEGRPAVFATHQEVRLKDRDLA